MTFRNFVFWGFVFLCSPSFAVSQQVNADVLRQFEFQRDVDLPGGDYSDSQDNPLLQGVTVERCAQICTLIETCVGFTYNQRARYCFPKHTVEGASAFKGAVSAIKQGLQTPDVVDNSFSPFLLKRNCKAVSSQVSTLSSSVTIKYPQGKLGIQRPAPLRVTTPALPERFPGFVVISFDQPVRFSGEGFYVLGPGAKGAFGSNFEHGKTRVVVPLFTKGRNPSLDFSVIPLTLAAMTISSSVVAQSGCGEVTAAVSTKKYEVPEVGQPKVFVYDQYGSAPPVERIVSQASDRHLDVFKGFFRLVASATNAPIAEIPGQYPAFSPTGRFVTAEFHDGVRLFDAVDGKPLGNVALNVAWDVADSFVIGDVHVWGKAIVRSPFIERKHDFTLEDEPISVGNACHACAAAHTVAIKIDLENDHVLAKDSEDDRGYAVSLTVPRNSTNTSAVKTVSQSAGIVPVKLPSRWETRDPLRFTNLAATSDGRNASELTGDDALLAQQFLLPRTRSKVEEPFPTSMAVAAGISLRSRLATQFGFEVANSVPFVELENVIYKRDKDELIAQKFGLPFSDRELLLKENCHDDGEGANYADLWSTLRGGETITLIGFGCTYGNTASMGALSGLHTSRDPGVIHEMQTNLSFDEVYYAGGGCGGDCGLTAELVSDRYILAWAKGSEGISVYDLENRRLATIDAYRGRLMRRVYLSEDHQHVLQENTDGTFAVYSAFVDDDDTRDTKLALSIGGNDQVAASLRLLGHYDDDELVVWEPGGSFDAGYEASHQIVLKFDGTDEIFDFSQFSEVSRKPGLWDAALRGEVRSEKVTYAIPPMISASHQQLDGAVRISFSLKGGGQPSTARIFQDGMFTSEHKLDASKRSWSLDIVPKLGVRIVSMVVVDEEGLRSAPSQIDLGEPQTKRHLMLLAVAVDDYADPTIGSLQFSKTDAFAFTEAIQGLEGRRYATVETDAIADADATGKEVLRRLKGAISRASENTDVMLYFSGHGLTDKQGNLYLALTDTKADVLSTSALAWTKISDLLASASGRVTVFLDTCHSGSAGQSLFSTNDAVADTLLVSNGSVTVLSASKGRQSSIEDSSIGGGVFTKALLDVITGRDTAPDTNGNGSIEVSEAYRSVKSNVIRLTNLSQTPWLAADQAAGDRPIF